MLSRPMPPAIGLERVKKLENKTHEVDVSDLTMPGELLRRLRVFLVTGSSKIPVLPEIATRLLEMSNKPRVEINHIVAEVERDATIAGRLLATANSAFYQRAQPSTSIRQAILRVGLMETRDIVYRIVAASTLFRGGAYAEAARGIRIHSMTVAYVARDICRRGGVDHDLAFLAGLLHDVGKVILLAAASASSKAPLPLEELADTLRADHTEAGALTAEYWKLPPPVIAAIRNHHSHGATEAYGTAVALADRICYHLGFEGEPVPLDARDATLIERFHFTPATIEEICQYALTVREALKTEG